MSAAFWWTRQTWAIRYLVVDTSNWWMGHKVLIAPPWISRRALVGTDRVGGPQPRLPSGLAGV